MLKDRIKALLGGSFTEHMLKCIGNTKKQIKLNDCV